MTPTPPPQSKERCETLFRRLARLFSKPTVERPNRKAAIAIVRAERSADFTEITPDAPGEGTLREDGWRHVMAHPREYFMCASCGDGPWHRSWTGSENRGRALGPCCTGAD